MAPAAEQRWIVVPAFGLASPNNWPNKAHPLHGRPPMLEHWNAMYRKVCPVQGSSRVDMGVTGSECHNFNARSNTSSVACKINQAESASQTPRFPLNQLTARQLCSYCVPACTYVTDIQESSRVTLVAQARCTAASNDCTPC